MRLARPFLILIVIALILVAALKLLIEQVPVDKIGVKQALWGGSGVVEKDYDMGFRIQRTLKSGANDHFTFGRNEPGVQYYHRMVAKFGGWKD